MWKGFRGVSVVVLGAAVAIGVLQVVLHAQVNPFRKVDGLQAGSGSGRLGVAWAKMPKGRKMGSPAGMDVQKDGSLWVAIRCEGDFPLGSQTNCDTSDSNPIMHFDKDGNLLHEFGSRMMSWPHGMTVDMDGNIWAAEAGAPKPAPGVKPLGHQVHKFSPQGKLLLSIGEAGKPGSDNAHFQEPTDVVVAPNGEVFIGDGHSPTGNNRVMVFTKDGKFIRQFGKTGYGPGEIRMIHALNRDPETGNIYVAERANQRVSIWEPSGKYINRTTAFGMPSDVGFDMNGYMYVADSESDIRENNGWEKGIRIGRTKTGYVEYFIPDPGDNYPFTGHGSGPESIGVAPDGTHFFAGEPRNHALQKYIRVF